MQTSKGVSRLRYAVLRLATSGGAPLALRGLAPAFALLRARGSWERYGALPLVSAGDTANHRRPHPRRGHPEAPLASETFCRPTSHCPSPCPPGSLGLVLCLPAP